MPIGLSNHGFSSIGSYPGSNNKSPGESANLISRCILLFLWAVRNLLSQALLSCAYTVSLLNLCFIQNTLIASLMYVYLQCDGILNPNWLNSSHFIYSQRPHIPNYSLLSLIPFIALRLSGHVWIFNRTLSSALIPPIKPGKSKAYSQEDCSR